MLKLIQETTEHYRIFSQAARTIANATESARVDAVCESSFDETPTVYALSMLSRWTEQIAERIFGAYIALVYLAGKAEIKADYVPPKEIARMRASWLRYYLLSKDLDKQARDSA